MNNRQRSRLAPPHIFIIVSAFLTTASLITLCTGQAHLSSIFFQDGNEVFGDFFNHLIYAADLPQAYEQSVDACFPPFAYLMYWLLGRMIGLVAPDAYAQYWDASSNVVVDANVYAQFAYAAYLCVVMLAFFACLVAITKMRPAKAYLIGILLVLSTPFFEGIIERANAAFVVLILLLAALLLRQKEGRLARELALICFACAVGFKLYPAVFVLLYLKERRFAEAARFCLYAALVFFVPFFVVGWEYLPVVFDHIMTVTATNNSIRTIQSAFGFVGNLLGYKQLFLRIGSVAALLYALCAAIGVFRTRSPWKTYFLLVTIMFMVPERSGFYCLTYLTVPFLFWLREMEERSSRAASGGERGQDSRAVGEQGRGQDSCAVGEQGSCAVGERERDLCAVGEQGKPLMAGGRGEKNESPGASTFKRGDYLIAILFGCIFCLMTIWPLRLEYVVNYAPAYLMACIMIVQTTFARRKRRTDTRDEASSGPRSIRP